MFLRLGNVSVNEIEVALGIKFTDEHRQLLESTRQQQVSETNNPNYKIPKDTWHAFELPMLQVHCGSKKFAQVITDILKSYMIDGGFPKKGAKIGITNETLEEEQFGYEERQQMINEGLEVYVGVETYERHLRDTVKFYVKTKETKAGNIFLQEVQKKRHGDYYLNNLVVPNVNKPATINQYEMNEDGSFAEDENGDFIVTGQTTVPPIRKKKREDNEYVIKNYTSVIELKLWDGKPIKTGF